MWVQSHQSLRNHPKIKKSARIAGINEFEMIGRLHCLWWWVLDYAPDGNISNYTDDDIEDAVDWSGERGLFVKALTDCGFNGHGGLIDVTRDSRVIHDWHEYGGKLLEKREANKERMRKKRAMHVQRTTDARTGAREDKIREDKKRSENTTESADKPRRTAKKSETPPQIAAYREIAHRYPNKSLYDDITSAVPESDIDFYKQVVKAWIGLGWNPSNIAGQLEAYKRREIPHKNGQSNGIGSTPQPAPIAPDREAALARAFR